MTPDHFAHLGRLLDLESKYEQWQTLELAKTLTPAQLEQRGLGLTDLVIRDENPGLGGHVILTLGKPDARQALPWLRLSDGSPVALQTPGLRRGLKGVMVGRDSTAVRVAIPELPDDLDEDAAFQLVRVADETTRLRQKAALECAAGSHGSRFAELRSVMLGERPPRFGPIPQLVPFDQHLNPSQWEAIRFALSAEDFAIIHGPPGTGKTTTLAELVHQAVAARQRVLVCAPSNLAVDNLLERLVAAGLNAVRLGHPARVLPAVQEHTLDALVERHPDVRQARKMVREAYALFRKADRFTRAKPEPGAKRATRGEARALLADARRYEDAAVERILNTSEVVCATLTGLDGNLLGKRTFDLLVIDEAGQGIEPAAWIGLLRCDRVILAGDHCQLPPTVLSPDAARQGLSVSLLERLIALHGTGVARRLKVQYRMHETIMAFSSAEFYDGELEADPSVRQHLLRDLPGVAATPLTETPVTFLDTAGAGYEEEVEEDGESRLNPQEADLVVRKVRELLAAGVRAEDVAVISPYAGQVRLLKQRLPEPGLEIDSIDGFQGREKEAVVLSLVRSNREGDIGFLADVRRMNVALTRARRKLLVVGDCATLANDAFYARLIEFFERAGAYRTVWEEGT
ncbi:MAG: AAA domain-containing protein [Gemmataceae bacterium]